MSHRNISRRNVSHRKNISPTTLTGKSDEEKVIWICDKLLGMKMSPKEFITGFLTKKHTLLKYRRRKWATKGGWTSTIRLLQIIANEFRRTRAGSAQWARFIEAEAISILQGQSTPKGNYPSGSFQSARTVTHTPFLFNLIVGALLGGVNEETEDEVLDTDINQYLELPPENLPTSGIGNSENDNLLVNPDDSLTDPTDEAAITGYLSSSADPLTTNHDLPTNLDRSSDAERMETNTDPTENIKTKPNLSAAEAEELSWDGYVLTTSEATPKDKNAQAKHIATVVCSMVAFARNRQANVNEYTHHMGLCSSRKTAIQALRSLTRDSEDLVIDAMATTHILAPPICIDNLDMEQKVHQATIGRQTRMFHGTWGYVHVPSKNLMDTLDPAKLTREAYHDSLKKAASMTIEPELFLPTDSSGDEYALVLKSQIAQVMFDYVATPANKKDMLPLNPPPVKQITAEVPEIHMLKLMDESDNSAEGIGQVMEALQCQSGLDADDFFGRLQLVDGDLGTNQIFNALRSLRLPSEYSDHNLNNIHFNLGAAHTLWNIAQTILTTHFGNVNKMDDLGVWRYLDAIGIPPEKVIQKKDFTKMIQSMQLVQDATLVHCLRNVMNILENPIEETLPVIPTSAWNQAIEQCYEKYCSPQARRTAAQQDCPKLSNLLIQIKDFSTVVEANRAMKAGDIGRLLRIWKMWSIMTQSLPGLTHYSAYLPRLVLLITHILPTSLAKLIRHTLLLSPSGRPNHFVAKDFNLKTNNYWLKFFFNRAGVGTQIERLKNLFSSNIPLLRSMFKSLRSKSGGKHFQQSHKTYLKVRALQRFDQMARDNDILAQVDVDPDDQVAQNKSKQLTKMPDTYLQGIKCLLAEVSGKPTELGRFLMHLPIYIDQDGVPGSDDDEEMLELDDGDMKGRNNQCTSSSISGDELDPPLNNPSSSE
ncbi:hypothetical protein PSHT_11758 [Puccinia striiformis]|uniref:DUF6589 domain-containing protein n=1 Tax=Puccinia striiformis TaxID=27350 RepID=A0A2S4V0Y2_9BASI|nr:hypothetical protein PSHT_11758 [Puccinia striiformis]